MDASLAVIDAKLAKAEQYLEVARLVVDEAFDAAVSLAAIAAINASDALLLCADRSTVLNRQQHEEAVRALTRAGHRDSARHLQRVLTLKNVAQYKVRRCTEAEALMAVQQAERLSRAAMILRSHHQ